MPTNYLLDFTPMSFPIFLDIESSTPDDGAFPTSIAWSLPDGQIKSVLICPDDDWDPWENCNAEVDLQHLLDQGESGPDIIRELNDDLSGQTVFVDGLDDDEGLLEKLFESFGSEPDFEIATLTQLYTLIQQDDILDQLRLVAEQHELLLDEAEDKVRSLLFLYAELQQNT